MAYSAPSSLARAQAAARTFVQKNVLPTDLVGVATIDVQRGYHLVTNFTTDRSAVAAAIDHPGTFRGTDPLQLIDVDHVRFYVGNAKQAAFFYANCFGFQIDQVSDLNLQALLEQKQALFTRKGRPQPEGPAP